MIVPPCGACGWQPQPRGRAVDFADGELGLVIGGKAKASEYSEGERIIFYRELLGVQQLRQYKAGWAAHKHLKSSAISRLGHGMTIRQ